MATRFSDDLPQNTDGSDFIVRRRIPLAMQIFLIYMIVFVAIYFTASIMIETGSKTIFFITLVISIGSLTWFTILFSARLRDLVLATEFQNAMLASAAQLSTRFCLITKRDGTIVYVDPGFQKVFPHFMQTADRTLDGLLGGAGITGDVVQKIALMLQQSQNDRILLSLPSDTAIPLSIMMSVDVLPRPKGYLLLRGRDYIEKRSAQTQTSQEAPLAQALSVLPEGILVADGAGGISYVNRAVEHWLGFETGEMTSRNLKTAQVIYQYAGMDAGRIVTGDFDGEIILQRKDKSLLTFYIRQASLGRQAGFSAILSPAELLKKK